MVAGTRSDVESLRYFMDRTPLGRKGHPDEIIGAAIFLATESSSMATGTRWQSMAGFSRHKVETTDELFADGR